MTITYPFIVMSFKNQIIAILLSAIAATCGFQSSADDFRGEKTLGLFVGYNTYNREPVAGAQFTYRFNRLLRLSPSVDYIFRRHGVDALAIDLNMDFLFPLSHGKIALYPYAGITYASWNYHGAAVDPEFNETSSRISRFGLNLGGGLDMNLTRSLRLSVKAGYTVIKEFHGANITAGIHYIF